MKRALLSLLVLSTISTAQATLDDYQIEMADSVGRDNAASAYAIPITNDSLMMQATMAGCKTPADIQEFIQIAKQAAHEQRIALWKVKEEQFAKHFKIGTTLVWDTAMGTSQNQQISGKIISIMGQEIRVQWMTNPTQTKSYTPSGLAEMILKGTFGYRVDTLN